MSTTTGISPEESELVSELRTLRTAHPATGMTKLLSLLREAHPEWSVSEKRLKKVLQQEGLMISSGTATSADGVDATAKAGESASGTASKKKKSTKAGVESRNYPRSSSDAEIKADKWTKKVTIEHLDVVKGKGLVATEHIEPGETVWKEDPWVLTADWRVYLGSVVGPICSHCSCPLSLRNSTSIIACTHCTAPTNQFCNRLCYSRAQAYHSFLCEGQNPACVPLLRSLRQNDWAAPHALARVTGRILTGWRNQNKGGGARKGGALASVEDVDWEGDLAYFEALAGWTLEDKYRSEGKTVAQEDHDQWKKTHELYVQAFYQPPTADGRSKLNALMKKQVLPADLTSKLSHTMHLCLISVESMLIESLKEACTSSIPT